MTSCTLSAALLPLRLPPAFLKHLVWSPTSTKSSYILKGRRPAEKNTLGLRSKPPRYLELPRPSTELLWEWWMQVWKQDQQHDAMWQSPPPLVMHSLNISPTQTIADTSADEGYQSGRLGVSWHRSWKVGPFRRLCNALGCP